MGTPVTHRRTTSETAEGTRVSLEPAAEAVAFVAPDAPLERIAVTEVTLRAAELLVEVELAAVCPHNLRPAAGARSAMPHVLGHQQVGRIVAFGPGSAPSTFDGLPLAVGDRIVWAREVGCGACATCAAGAATACATPRRYGSERVRRGWELSGGLATHVHLLAGTVIARARDWVPAAVMVPVSCASATAAAVVEAAAGPLDGSPVVVSGCDTAGLTAIALLRDVGSPVLAVDDDPARRALAAEFGADVVQSRAAPVPRGATVLDFTPDGADDAPRITTAGRTMPLRGYRAEHLVDAVRFLERVDHDLFAGLAEPPVTLAAAADLLRSHEQRTCGLLTVRP